MKKINKIVLLCSVFLITFFSCKDDSLVVIPEWGTGVNTYATLQTGASSSFISGKPAVPVDVNFRWISIDGANTVTKVEFFLLFNEGYVDADGNLIRTPYMGVFEFRDGKICRWRDYVDTGLIAMAKAREPFPEWLETLVA